MIDALLDTLTYEARSGDRNDWPSRDNPQARKRAANDFIQDGLGRLDPHEPIPFFCECSRPDCFAAVWMRPGAFHQIRARRSGRAIARMHAAGDRSAQPGRAASMAA